MSLYYQNDSIKCPGLLFRLVAQKGLALIGEVGGGGIRERVLIGEGRLL